LLLLGGCGPVPGPVEPAAAKPHSRQELRGAWLSYYELDMQDQGGGTAQSFREKIQGILDNLSSLGVTDLFAQLRPFCDALYPSKLFPWSHILTGTPGKDPGYNPLAILLEEAKTRSLRVHGWLNPFRVLRQGTWDQLAAGSPARRWQEDDDPDNDRWLRPAEGGLYLNPAVPQAHRLVLDGVRELLENYDLAGIHIDDYFYPTTKEAFDAEEYQGYVAAGGTAVLADWRRAHVSAFVGGLYATVKALRPDCLVSVSPAANLQDNQETLYADVAGWARAGLMDWLIPQLYFGFEHETRPFESLAQEWAALPRAPHVGLAYGLAAYKIGSADSGAGTGKTEWRSHDDILSRQVALCRGVNGCGGFVFYSYSGLFQNLTPKIAKNELKNLKNVL
jgi:uncharacterized lipoprotein YddW (UPF0748 family)